MPMNLPRPGPPGIIRPLYSPPQPDLPTTTGFLRAALVRRPRTIGTKVVYRLQPPQVVTRAPVVTGPLGTLALQVPRRATHYKLSAPVVVNPAPPVVTTLRVTLAQRKVVRRPVLYKLRQPTVLSTPTVVAPFAPIQTHLAKWRRPRPTIHQLRLGLTATATVEVHDCRKTLLTDATGVFGTLAEAAGAQGTLALSSGSQGSLVDSGGTHGTLAETSTTKGTLTDTC